jgi:hypothetical protein
MNSNALYFLDKSKFNFAQINSSFLTPFRTNNLNITNNKSKLFIPTNNNNFKYSKLHRKALFYSNYSTIQIWSY